MVEIITVILPILGGVVAYYLHRQRIKFENRKSHTKEIKQQAIGPLLSYLQDKPSLHIVELDKIIYKNYYIGKKYNSALVEDLVENHSPEVRRLWNDIITNRKDYSNTESELRSKIEDIIISECKERDLKYRLDNTNDIDDYDCLLIEGLVELIMRDLRGIHKFELEVKGKYIEAGAYRLWQSNFLHGLFLHNIKEDIEDIIWIIENDQELIRLADKLNQLDRNINETKKLLCNKLQELLATEVLRGNCKFID